LLLLKTEIDTLLVAGWLKVIKIKKKEKKKDCNACPLAVRSCCSLIEPLCLTCNSSDLAANYSNNFYYVRSTICRCVYVRLLVIILYYKFIPSPCTLYYLYPMRVQALSTILRFYIFYMVSERLASRRRSYVVPPLPHRVASEEISPRRRDTQS
jgi:hypothetical protein